MKKRKKEESERKIERMSKSVSERERKRVNERGTHKSKHNYNFRSAPQNITTCNRNFFVAMYLPTNE